MKTPEDAIAHAMNGSFGLHDIQVWRERYATQIMQALAAEGYAVVRAKEKPMAMPVGSAIHARKA